jgi:hypothetical protein
MINENIATANQDMIEDGTMDAKVEQSIIGIGNTGVTQMDNIIDPDDFDEDYDPKDLEIIKANSKKGILKPTGMYPVFTQDDGSGMYGRRVEYKGGESKFVLVYCQSNGSRSKNIEIENWEIVFLSQAITRANNAEDIKTKNAAVREVTRLSKNLCKKILPYWYGNILLSSEDIIGYFMKNITKLPYDNSLVLNIDIVRAKIEKFAKECADWEGEENIYRNKYYAFNSDDFEKLADRFQTTTKELARYLVQNSLLVLQPSSGGYQCRLKYLGNCYCITVPEAFQKPVIKLSPVNKDEL